MENKEEVVIQVKPNIHVPDIVDPADEVTCDSFQ